MKKIIFILGIFLLIFITGCSQKYNVNFNIFDGVTENQIVNGGETITPFTPEMEGYTFLYWTYEDEEFDVNTPIKNNITLSALWKKNDYTVHFVIDNTKTTDVLYETGDIIKEIIPSKEDYLFLGWYENDALFDFTEPIKREVTLNAKWVLDSEYKIELNVSFNSTKSKQDIDPIKINRLDCISNLPTLSVENNIFLGWYLNDNLVTEDTIIKEINDFTLIAKWYDMSNTNELSFNTDGGNTLSNMTCTYGQTISLPTPVKEGYTFSHWCLDEEVLEEEFVYNFMTPITIKAYWNSELTEMVCNGNTVTYRKSTETVMIPKNYVTKTEELRAVWVSSYISDFSPSSDKETMMKNLTSVLDKMDEYNMNAIVFHLRTTNNAFYKTTLAPINSSYGTYETFEEWDYLEWFIEECHKRGIEFHAWLNPYRIKTSGYSVTTTPADVSEDFSNYPKNPASNPDNILMTYSSSTSYGAILNPAKTAVQDYIVNVCKELARNYDIDAIHFDDYFYAKLSNGSNILSEADQNDYESFISVNSSFGYSKTDSTNKADWRRYNVSCLMKKLNTMLNDYYVNSGNYVQLGISPTGIWQNGNGSVSYDNEGLAITSGSNTNGYAHYGSPLYADTILWANNGWIDYLIPQTYWETNNSAAPFPDLVDWWANALKNVDTKLYLGIGVYKSFSSSAGSWYTDKNELINQMLYSQKNEKVQGVCIFSYKQLLYIESGANTTAHDALIKLRDVFWVDKVTTPKFK